MKSTISSAGSARKPINISRRAPSEPKAVPRSIAASAMKTRAVAKSADQRDGVGRPGERKVESQPRE